MEAFSDIQLFALIVQLGSMAAAAQELGVTPPVVTRRLAQLEKRLGVRLLHRSTRQMSLTPEGEVYWEQGVRILQEMSALEDRVRGGGPHVRGTLRVSATLGFGRTWVAPALSKLTQQHPHLDVQLHLSDKSVNLVAQGFDVRVRFGESSDSRLTARLLAHNRRILCAAPSYLKRHGHPSHPRELSQHPCIFIREGDETFGTWQLSRGTETESIKVRANLSTNDGTSALGWALEGQGILARSQWEIAQALRDQTLIPVLTAWALPPADIHLLFQASQPMPVKVRVLVDFLLEAFKARRGPSKTAVGRW